MTHPYRTGSINIDWIKSMSTVDNNNCWLWNLYINEHGYPRMGFKENGKIKTVYVNRYICEMIHGPFPSRKGVALHSCDVRHCVNPDHIFPATQAQNMQDAVAKGRPIGRPKKSMLL